MEETIFDLKPARKTFSRVGFAMVTILLVATVASLLWDFAVTRLGFGENTTWSVWMGTIVPLYLIAMPAGAAILHTLPAHKPQDNPMTFGQLLRMFCIGYAIMIGGNLIGIVMSMLLSGGTATNDVAELAMDTNPMKILVMVILAPLLEELICRKLIIDRIRCYGEKTAVLVSGLIFGLLHQNFFQFFYAFGLGVLLGYLYIRTGRLRYTVIFHVIVNFLGSVVAPFILNLLPMELLESAETFTTAQELLDVLIPALPGILVYSVYSMCISGVMIFGVVMLIVRFKKAVWNSTSLELPKGTAWKTSCVNVGMIVYSALCLISCIAALFM